MERLPDQGRRQAAVYRISLSALFLALLITGAYVRIPFPVIPITLQPLVVLTAAMLLGPGPAGASVGVYLLMGLAGLPVFASGGGLYYIFKPTFGYLLGFLAAALLTGTLSARMKEGSAVLLSLAGMAGVAVIYAAGVGYMLLLPLFYTEARSSLASLFTLNFALTILSDLIKCVIAASLAVRLRKILGRSPRFRSLYHRG